MIGWWGASTFQWNERDQKWMFSKHCQVSGEYRCLRWSSFIRTSAFRRNSLSWKVTPRASFMSFSSYVVWRSWATGFQLTFWQAFSTEALEPIFAVKPLKPLAWELQPKLRDLEAVFKIPYPIHQITKQEHGRCIGNSLCGIFCDNPLQWVVEKYQFVVVLHQFK